MVINTKIINLKSVSGENTKVYLKLAAFSYIHASTSRLRLIENYAQMCAARVVNFDIGEMFTGYLVETLYVRKIEMQRAECRFTA